MSGGDLLHRFLFEQLPVRGHLVRLDASWRAAIEHHAYPRAVSDALGEAMAASVLMAGALKFDGRLSLQFEGSSGPLRLLLAQCTHRHAVRGVARHEAPAAGPAPAAGLFGDGQLAVTIDQAEGGERYQGVVPLDGAGLAASLERYFDQSEQLPSRLVLAATTGRACGLLLQRVAVTAGPAGGETDADDAWRRIGLLAQTLSAEELLELPCRELLQRLFPEDDIRLFEGTPVFFQCSCSRERVAGILQALGGEEVRSILAERGDVEVRCEFCNRAWRFDAVDVAGLFSEGAARQAPPGLH
jgi:molecular chaperone Hsp33